MSVKLSIITVNLNNAKGLIETIESVVSQSYKKYELIIIDGASTDGSIGVIKQHSKKINNWVSEKDSGIYNAMNKGIYYARGEYCLFLNSGDYLVNNDILKEIFDKNYTEDILSGIVEVCNSNSKRKKYYFGPNTSDITLSVLLETSLNHQATFIKRYLFNKYGMYDENYKVISDWIFSIKVLINNNVSFRFIDILISKIEPEGISANQNSYLLEREKALSELVNPRILKDYKELDFFGLKRIKKKKITWYIYLFLKKITFIIS